MKYKNIIMILSFFYLNSSVAIEVHGHRGARARFPENTLPAFEHALQVGADYLELDLGITQDEQVIVSHEVEVHPKLCLNSKGKPAGSGLYFKNLTLAQVKTYDCGSVQNQNFPEQQTIPHTPIPSLDEVFRLILTSKLPHAKTIKFNVELKTGHENETIPTQQFAKIVYDKVKSYKLLNRVVFQSFDYKALSEIRALDSQAKISALTNKPFENLVKTAKKLKANYISPNEKILSAKEVKDLHQMGVQVIPWTSNSEKSWKKLIDMKVDAIITDDPQALIEYLQN